MTPTVTYFVTTARSGTQWLAETLGRLYPDLLRVEHEPVGYRYAPNRTLRNPAALRRLCDDARIRDHFAEIGRALREGRSYVEVGFPGYALAPLLRQRFGDRLRLVQLTRDPMRVAGSLVTHRWYTSRARPDVRETVALTPFHSGATLGHYTKHWDRMSAFERGLFYWYEVHRYGLDLESAAVPGSFARVRLEDLVTTTPARRRLTRFLDLPERDGWKVRRQVDRYRFRTAERINWTAVARHPEIVDLAATLGYAPEHLDRKALRSRYQRGTLAVLGKSLKRAAARLF